LATYAAAVARGGSADPADLGRFARFFREFADQLHHEKEVSILLPTLTRHGFRWDEGVLADVRRDHDQERYLIDVLCQVSERHTTWTEEDRRSIAATALALSDIQHVHLTRENEQLFPEVTRRLSADVMKHLSDELARFDACAAHHALNLELVEIAMHLVTRYARPQNGSCEEPEGRSSSVPF
jgi:hemerythrin-like domain-containing protein